MNYHQITRQRSSTITWILFFLAAYAVIAFYGLRQYMHPFSINFILGSLAVFSSLTVGNARKRPMKFAVLSLALAVWYLILPAKTILFASVSMAVFFIIEVFIGRVNRLSVFSLILMSPIFEYLTSIFSFPIRLLLTTIAGNMISLVKPGTIIEGNVIINGSSEFSVDPACMGLHMLITSLLASMIITSIIQKKQERQVSASGLLIIISSVFALNIISNLFRILCLVYFSIPPESYLHGVVGITCFLVYVIAPAMSLINVVIRKFAHQVLPAQPAVPAAFNVLFMNLILIVLTGIGVYVNRDFSANEHLVINRPSLQGYTTTDLPNHITKLENNHALIYVKPIAGFYSSDHHPMMCWTGSGYQFKKIKEKKIGEHTVYTAVLEKEKDILYSAWWYENGDIKTISQLEWRWKSLMGEKKYSLVNVTALTPLDLDREIAKLFYLDPFEKIIALK